MTADPLDQLADADRARLERVLVEFDLNWSPDRLTSAIAELSTAGTFRTLAIRELVKIDIERQAANGTPVRLSAYTDRFAELRDNHWIDPLLDAEKSTTAGGTDTPPEPPSLPETFGRYSIKRLLGRGAMGSVYLAHDGELDRLVALKVPHFPLGDSVAAERFAREARAAATIDHPNVCRVYDVGRIGETAYLTMAYVEGSTLAEFLRHGPLPPRRSVEIARHVALALAAAHGCGVIHRDLKPGNILIGSNGHAFVTDFGLARREKENRLTGEGELIGTPLYMSPEQIAGATSRVGPASDIYALGVVFHEMLTGSPPFAGSRSNVFLQTLSELVPPPSTRRDGVDFRLDQIVLRALAKSPADRFKTMTEFAAKLEDWLRLDASPKGWRRWFRWIRRQNSFA